LTSEAAIAGRQCSTSPARPDISVGGRRIEIAAHNCFACGQLNVHGLRLELHAADDRCWTEVRLPERFEGWEGIAHGGIVCTLLDEVMAWALIEHDTWGVTARLSVEFRRPVRVGTPIRAEGWTVQARRRLLDTAGRVIDLDTGQELAVATARYVAADEDRRAELKSRYRFRLVDEPGRSGDDDPAPPDGVAEAGRAR